MVEIPAHVTCFELLQFIAPVADKIIESKIIRDDSPNQYFVVIRFKSSVGFNNVYILLLVYYLSFVARFVQFLPGVQWTSI